MRGGTTRFHFVEPPSTQELASMVATICERGPPTDWEFVDPPAPET